MDAFLIAFESVLPLFLVIFTGLLFSKTGAANANWIEILNKYALWIGFPALVITSLMQLKSGLSAYLPLIITNSVYIVAGTLLAFPIAAIFRLPLKVKQSLFLLLPFGNIAYLGIPVLENTYGKNILPVAAILAALYVFWMLTLSLLLIELTSEKRPDVGMLIKNLLKNPLLLSVFAGLAIIYFNIPIPTVIEKTLTLFSQSVTAVVLFSLGIFLGLHNAGRLQEWVQVGYLSLATMVLLPAVFFLILQHVTLPVSEFKAAILEAAMPAGLTPYALSVQYELDSKLISRVIVLSTTLSLLILPAWIFFLG